MIIDIPLPCFSNPDISLYIITTISNNKSRLTRRTEINIGIILDGSI